MPTFHKSKAGDMIRSMDLFGHQITLNYNKDE